MDYKTYAPSAELATFIKLFWSLEAPAEIPAERQRIVPDGCMEMIFHYGDLYEQFIEEDKSIIQPRCFVFGQITSPLEIAATGKTGIIAARFFPEGFAPFSTMPIASMDNRAVPLHTLYGERSHDFESAVLKAATHEERIKIIEQFLLKQLETPESVDVLAKSCVEILFRSNGDLSVDLLAEEVQTNRRKLERKFSSAIGLSPKQLSKIIRLQATLKMMEQKQFTSLTALAYENGYFDQAHFIKDFKEFTGISPRQFYSSNLKMSTLFIGTE